MKIINPLDLTGRKYLITGAASGIGRASSVFLSQLGAELILVDINAQELEKTASSCPSKVLLVACDLLDIPKLKESIINAVSDFGKIHGLVHIAGKSYISPLKAISENGVLDTFKLNTYAGLELAKLFINKKIYAGEHGSIVFISSVYGIVGSPANVGYAVSKAGIIGATKALAMELAPQKIRVNCVAPGFVKTKMMDSNTGSFDDNYLSVLDNLHPLGLGEPEDIANAISFMLSDMSKWITGAVMNVDGGFTAQ
ncbi:MAG: SDR family oxidoreductase [Bacteroidales bacterium]|jgi:NAD(P)-dependent dehydrogenase (short-subunit alcohol dehydrogenase family)|nr:SDR family oxidoreductase [Bacteroidales bacterium]